MTKVKIEANIAEQIRQSDGPIELVDDNGQTIGTVRRPPTEDEIKRANSRASQGGERLTFAQVTAKVQDTAER